MHRSPLKATLLLLITLAFALCSYSHTQFHPVIKTPIKNLPIEDLPSQFWWGNVNGTNYLTLQKNQHIPQYCGSCWAFSVTSSLSDRIKIMRNATWPDINLAPQILLSCDMSNHGCDGGNPPKAFKWIHQNNITDQTCSPYQALSHMQGLGCTAEIKCKNCSSTSCSVQKLAKIYTIGQYGVITQKQGGQVAMMNEIYRRGPIVCEIAVTRKLHQYTGGIFIDLTGKKGYDHDISVTGWGQENGTKFWYIRNSWGTYWGENGDFRLIRGVDNLGIQSNCSWGVPIDTWTNDTRNTTLPTQFNSVPTEQPQKKSLKTQHSQAQPQSSPHQTCYTPLSHQQVKKYQYIISQQPYKKLKLKDIPTSWDWRNVSGVNYLSINKNQHLPVYCGSCWAMAGVSALSDRINIARNRTWPDILLSTQFLLNCKMGGSCTGGSSISMYYHAHLSAGIPEETCQNYVSKDPENATCSDIQRCQDCDSQTETCFPTLIYPVWRVIEYGSITGADKMKAQIYSRGPITCALQATPKFHQYTGGIFAEVNLHPSLNHQISIVGWGVQNGVEYWIGRNSWGTYWGENGFFRIQMYRNNNGVQTACSWGSVEKKARIIDIRSQPRMEKKQLVVQ